MVAGAVHRGPPYRTVQALGAWALKRRNYLRGRLLLAGQRWDDLSVGEMMDVVEAIFGEGAGVDTHLGNVEEQIAIMFPDRARWGLTEAQQAAQAAAMSQLLGEADSDD